MLLLALVGCAHRPLNPGAQVALVPVSRQWLAVNYPGLRPGRLAGVFDPRRPVVYFVPGEHAVLLHEFCHLADAVGGHWQAAQALSADGFDVVQQRE
jgi:hypothetical protein